MGKLNYFETAIDGCQVCLRIDLETKYKVMRKFGKGAKTTAEAFKEAIYQSVEGVKLTAADKREIAAQTEANFQKRMEKRAARPNKLLATKLAYRKWEKPTK